MTATRPRYGTLFEDYVATWPSRPADEPMWALNLMKYRPVADYEDGRPTTLTGWEADDLYAPVEPLAKVGAEIALVAPVLHQCAGDDVRWDRVAVVRYPSRMAMAEMEQLPEFQALHVHKDAGMQTTIVAATFPAEVGAGWGAGGRLLLELVADAAAPDLGGAAGGTPLARFDVEGVIVGDRRRWAQARWHRIDAAAAAALAEREPQQSGSTYAMVLDPWLDRMPDLLAPPRRTDPTA